MSPTMTRFLLVRHGETEWNTQGRVQGGGSLTPRGLAQVQALASRLSRAGGVAAILASPAQRARETAEALSAALGLPVETRDGLLDLDYGVWSGAPLEAARKRDPGLFRRWAEEPHTVHFPGGESLEDLRRRVLAVAEEAQGRFPEGSVLLVTHDSPIRIVVCYALGLDDSHHNHFKVDVGSLTIVDLGGKAPVLVTLNDTCHLGHLDGNH